jgi:hypothetical protein
VGEMLGERILGRPRRLVAILVAVGLATGLFVITAGVVSAAPGGNNANAKICKDWASLFREDGSTFADRGECTSYAAEGGIILTSPPVPPLPNRVTVNAPSPAAGTYGASGAEFGPSPSSAGVSGSLVLVNDGTAAPNEGCSPIVGFPAGAIAVVDRGGCAFTVKVANAQAAGAVAVVVANDVAGVPTTMDGADATITIPAVMVSQSDGATIKAGLPATGIVASSS